MKKSVELKKELETLRNEITSLKDSGKIEEAHAKLNNLKDLENRIKEAETEEALTVMNKGNKSPLGTNEEMDVNRIYNKVLLGKSITEEEKQFLNAAGTPGQVEATDGKGGYLVPTEQFNQIKELRRNKVELKVLCNVQPVKSLKGTMPIEKDGTGELIAFEELNEIKKDDFEKEITLEIKSRFEEIFSKHKDSFLFRYKILLILEFDTYSNEFYFENKERKEELKSKMDEYINEILLKENNLIKDHRECYIFCRNLLDFNLMGYSEKHLTELIEKILQVLSSIKNEKAENDFKYNIILFLEDWTKNIFLKLKPKEVTEDQLDLYVYKALFQLKYSKYKDDIIYAYEDLKNASDNYHSQKAKQYLEKESATLADKLIYYRDENLEEL
nr:MAG TPA: major capsid protein [Caudoviricetes sp.]